MAQVLVRGVDPEVLDKLKARAKRNGRSVGAELRSILEEAAREVRYRFLGETARKVAAGRVAIGHTRDDQVETVLLHYLRGSGVSGLRGIEEVCAVRLISATAEYPAFWQVQGREEEALALYQDSLKVDEELGDRRGAAVTKHSIADIHRLRGDYEPAP